MGKNSLDFEGVQAICESLERSAASGNLRKLDLSSCFVSDSKGVHALVVLISKAKALQVLNISEMSIEKGRYQPLIVRALC